MGEGAALHRYLYATLVEASDIGVLPQTAAARLGASPVHSLPLLVWEEREHMCFDVPLTCNAKYLQIRLHTAQGQQSDWGDHLSLPEVVSLVYIASKCIFVQEMACLTHHYIFIWICFFFFFSSVDKSKPDVGCWTHNVKFP